MPAFVYVICASILLPALGLALGAMIQWARNKLIKYDAYTPEGKVCFDSEGCICERRT